MKLKENKGFTLIEMLLVVIIISTLATMIMVHLGGKSEEAKIAAAEAEIEVLSNALDMYELHNGRYPTSGQGLQSLYEKPTQSPIPKKWKGPYLKRKKKGLKDPWGEPYEYRSPGDHNTESYDLFSIGSDGEEGSDDDVFNWESEEDEEA